MIIVKTNGRRLNAKLFCVSFLTFVFQACLGQEISIPFQLEAVDPYEDSVEAILWMPEVKLDTTMNEEVVINNLHKLVFYTEDSSGNELPIRLGIVEKLTAKITYKKGVKVQAKVFYDNGSMYGSSFFDSTGLVGWQTEWFKNGQKRALRNYEKGGEVYPEIEWHENGSVKQVYESQYKITSWHKNGRVSYLVEALPGKGRKMTSFYSNGNVKRQLIDQNGVQPYIENFKNGKSKIHGFIDGVDLFRVGNWTEWYENGQKRLAAFYHDSLPNHRVGKWKYWDEQGNLIKEEFYQEGKLVDVKEYIPKPEKR